MVDPFNLFAVRFKLSRKLLSAVVSPHVGIRINDPMDKLFQMVYGWDLRTVSDTVVCDLDGDEPRLVVRTE